MRIRILIFTSLVVLGGVASVSFSGQPSNEMQSQPTPIEQASLETLSKKVDDLKSTNQWAIVVPAIVGLVGVGGSIAVTIFSQMNQRRLTKQQLEAEAKALMTNSLSYFEGGSQKRSIGIAIIEGNWQKPEHQEFRNAWRLALTTQAVYILSKSCKLDSNGKPGLLEEHEFLNLENILRLITAMNGGKPLPKKSGLHDVERDEIESAFDMAISKHEAVLTTLKSKVNPTDSLKDSLNRMRWLDEKYRTNTLSNADETSG